MRESTPLSADNLEVLIVDDRSTDDTKAIGQSLQQQPGDPRLKILAGQPRPGNQYWAGKNWVCAQAVEVATGDFLLFIDADVRLTRGDRNRYRHSRNRENRLVHLYASAGKASVLPSG